MAVVIPSEEIYCRVIGSRFTMATDKFDSLLLGMAQQSEGISGLLTTVFSFLERKTDFFSAGSQKQVEDLVLKIVREQRKIANAREPQSPPPVKKINCT